MFNTAHKWSHFVLVLYKGDLFFFFLVLPLFYLFFSFYYRFLFSHCKSSTIIHSKWLVTLLNAWRNWCYTYDRDFVHAKVLTHESKQNAQIYSFNIATLYLQETFIGNNVLHVRLDFFSILVSGYKLIRYYCVKQESLKINHDA